MDEERERKKKIIAIILVCVAPICVFLAFVLPRLRGGEDEFSADAEAGKTSPSPPTATAQAPSAPVPTMPPMPMGGGGAPFSPMSGGAPGGLMGPSGAGRGRPAAGAAEPAAPEPVRPPLWPRRDNPFAGTEDERYDIRGFYGPSLATIPITAYMSFPRPERPPPKPPPPPTPPEVEKYRRVTGVLWTDDGKVLAIVQEGEEGKLTGSVLRPGDVIDGNVVESITPDGVILRDRETDQRREIRLESRKENPPPKRQPPTAPRMPGAAMPGGTVPGMPMMPGAPAAPAAAPAI